MHEKIHKELTYEFLKHPKNKEALDFLLLAIAKPEWNWANNSRIEWLKTWMDAPDAKIHSSKIKNDHSYKIKQVGSRFQIEFAKKGSDQATVVARLKYDFRDVTEWKKEHEYRTCGIELAKSVHWVVDLSTPPHTITGWSDSLHSKIEKDFDKNWNTIYTKCVDKVKFNRKKQIKDIYRWAKKNIEDRYAINKQLLELYEKKGSILKGNGVNLGMDVMKNLLQNLADYFAYVNEKIGFLKTYNQLKADAL
jgi:hypothetical protein